MAGRFQALDLSSSDDEIGDVESNSIDQCRTLIDRNDQVEGICQKSHQNGGSLITRLDPMIAAIRNNIGQDGNNLGELGFSDADLIICTKVIDIIGSNLNLFKLPALKPLRASLHPLIVDQMNRNYEVEQSKKRRKPNHNTKYSSSTEEEAQRRTEKIAKMESEYINQTQLRAIRLQQLEKLNEQGEVVPRIPDGVALTSAGEASSTWGQGSNSANLLIGDGTKDSNSGEKKGSEHSQNNFRQLHNPLSCYICHKPYLLLHFFYAQLCPDCAEFNYQKRFETADMRGKVCLVTGARTKIGFQSTLKLLR